MANSWPSIATFAPRKGLPPGPNTTPLSTPGLARRGGGLGAMLRTGAGLPTGLGAGVGQAAKGIAPDFNTKGTRSSVGAPGAKTTSRSAT